MPNGNRDIAVTTGTICISRSRIGASLRRLHQTLERTAQHENQMAGQFATWEQKWSSCRDQIAQRLAIIDAQLEQLVQNNLRQPQLSVLATAEELNEGATAIDS